MLDFICVSEEREWPTGQGISWNHHIYLSFSVFLLVNFLHCDLAIGKVISSLFGVHRRCLEKGVLALPLHNLLTAYLTSYKFPNLGSAWFFPFYFFCFHLAAITDHFLFFELLLHNRKDNGAKQATVGKQTCKIYYRS